VALFSAKPYEDYTPVQKSVVIPAGSASAPVDVTIDQENVQEMDEHFFGVISAASNQAKIGDGSGTGTIPENDHAGNAYLNILRAEEPVDHPYWKPASFSCLIPGACQPCVLHNSSVFEGTAAGNTVGVKWALDGNYSNPIELYFETRPGTAIASDFVSTTGSGVVLPYTFVPTVQPMNILIANFQTRPDSVKEANEAFSVRVTGAGVSMPESCGGVNAPSPDNAFGSIGSSSVTITNDD